MEARDQVLIVGTVQKQRASLGVQKRRSPLHDHWNENVNVQDAAKGTSKRVVLKRFDPAVAD